MSGLTDLECVIGGINIYKKNVMIGLIILILSFIGVVVWLWVGGIDYMNKHHSDYKGEDFLNWKVDKEDKEQIL